MEDRFDLLVVDETTVNNHVGEEYTLYREVIPSPTRNQLNDYTLFFRGIIRSAWHDISKNIIVLCDTSDDYCYMFERIKAVMEEEEGITFVINKE